MNSFHFERPTGPVVMRPKWRHLLFLHWDFDPQTVQKHLPEGLEVDTFEGRAYVGLVPFVMEQVRPNFVPNLGRLGHFYENFAELNVRTYVVKDGVRGVWFFSLDAASSLATLTARAWFHLPYFKARMRFWRDEAEHGAIGRSGCGPRQLLRRAAQNIALKAKPKLPPKVRWSSSWSSVTCFIRVKAGNCFAGEFIMRPIKFSTPKSKFCAKVAWRRRVFATIVRAARGLLPGR